MRMQNEQRKKRRLVSRLRTCRKMPPDDICSTGYSTSVSQTPEGTRVKAKVGKDTNVNSLRKQLQQKYPGAKIEREGGSTKPLIREISTKTLKHEDEESKEADR